MYSHKKTNHQFRDGYSYSTPEVNINILYQLTLLNNKLKKKKKILELNNPKIFRNLKDSLVLPEITIDAATKPKKKKELIVPAADKALKVEKSKTKNKLKVYEQLGDEDRLVDSGFNEDSHKAVGSNRKRAINNKKVNIKAVEFIDDVASTPTEITISNPLPIKDLAHILGKSEIELIKFLFLQGIAVTINEIVDLGTIELIAQNFDVQVRIQKDSKEFQRIPVLPLGDKYEDIDLETRSPVVAVLGHVDHGKTSLLDKIRDSQTAQEEAGGITQVLNAYKVNWKNEKIVFLDTPGHAAFSQMRSRGASIMDIAILVVAADDIVQPQTIESIQHIQSAKVPMLVALNKIDKDTANTERIREQLADYGIISEEWGGDTIFVPVSALTGENIAALLDSIMLVASMKNLKASSKTRGKGIIIEAHLDKNKGVAVTILVREGTFRKSDIITSHTMMGKIRMITDESKQPIIQAGPSQIIKIWGFAEMAQVGELVIAHNSEKEGRAQVKEIETKASNFSLRRSGAQLTWLDSSRQKDTKILNLIIKSSTQGTLEAVLQVIQDIPQTKVTLKVVSAALGEITETDISFASTTKAIIVGFDTSLAQGARQASSRLGISIYEHQVIYDLVDKLEKEMCDLLDPEYDKKEIGISVVKDIFELAKGKVAGCYVESGKLVNHCNIQIIRNDQVIYEGEIDSLKRLKEDVEEVNLGNECGIFIKRFQDWRKNDLIKGFELIFKKPSLV
uniref:translation initiation factor 2 n=1 Tax=Rhodospora sordida TaxID=362230 RepID=UPI001FCD914D|nr:translation initiation factor 2 [Rhodospora sordida]UNJ14988.1 translation initiation factor 2 [Rhodospora sordida]